MQLMPGGTKMKWLALLTSVVAPLVSSAWTSGGGPLCDDVHQDAIAKVLKPLGVSNGDLQRLEAEQSIIDKDQLANQSDEHAMTGVVHAAHFDAALKSTYIRRTEALLHKSFTDAIAMRVRGNSEALTSLGAALHALEDATSPAHEGFQPWGDDFGLWEMTQHVLKERVYPTGTYQRNLEGVVRYAYDIYIGRSPIPVMFFDPTSGLLSIPLRYSQASP